MPRQAAYMAGQSINIGKQSAYMGRQHIHVVRQRLYIEDKWSPNEPTKDGLVRSPNDVAPEHNNMTTRSARKASTNQAAANKRAQQCQHTK